MVAGEGIFWWDILWPTSGTVAGVKLIYFLAVSVLKVVGVGVGV